ncbi:aminotransferase class I/II-fold pyridoxal phosphate-dependent enzyme [Patescibacteria group bacterium]|nr:aminotransferase class I/II-fold pyridoxal phosphate-dependent enzyme [Patescibacteria group bacterium]
MKLSNRLNKFPEYIFSVLDKKVLDVEKKNGRKVLSFGAGSPDFPPNKILIKKLQEFIAEPDAHMYPGYGAIPELTAAIKFWYKERFAVNLDDDELFPLFGAKDGVSHLTLALLDDGDEFLLPDPGYPGFSGPALMIGAKPVFYNLLEKNDFKIDVKELEKKVSKRTRFIWVNFPANPTGQVATVKELEKIVDFARRHHIWLVYDNAYSEVTFGGFVAPSILQIKGAKDVCVEIGSFSKMFSFAGFRMGWIAGNRRLIAALAKVKSQVDSGMTKAFQKLGAYALTNFDADWHRKMIASYEKRRDIIVYNLKKIGLEAKKTEGSLYLWVRIPDGYKDSGKYSMDLLEKRQILLVPGTAYGKNGKRFVRVSICVNVDNIKEYFY